MLGIRYFAKAQVAAAVERPPALKAIFPVAVTDDLYGAFGTTVFSTPVSFLTGFPPST
jgi:hypothetical protein